VSWRPWCWDRRLYLSCCVLFICSSHFTFIVVLESLLGPCSLPFWQYWASYLWFLHFLIASTFNLQSEKCISSEYFNVVVIQMQITVAAEPPRPPPPRPKVTLEGRKYIMCLRVSVETEGWQNCGNTKKLRTRIRLYWLHSENFSWQHWMFFRLFTLRSACVCALVVIVLSDNLCERIAKWETCPILKEGRWLVRV
jgi:hypothetical protein